MNPSQKWKSDLEAWAIPQEIIDQATESPWIHPPVLFQIPKLIDLTPSHQKLLKLYQRMEVFWILVAGEALLPLLWDARPVKLLA